MMLPTGCYDVNQLSAKLERSTNTADAYGLFSELEKICKRQKVALRSGLETTRASIVNGELYVLHLLRRSDHVSTRWAKVSEDLARYVDNDTFAEIVKTNSTVSDQLTIRPEVRG
jgi:hypothetical protein